MEFNSTDKCQNAFVDFEKRVSEALVLCGHDWTLPFNISSDSSDTTIGAILGH